MNHPQLVEVTEEEFWAALRRIHNEVPAFKITIVIKPNRGASGESKLSVHDRWRGPLVEPILWVAPGAEEVTINHLVKKHGTAKVSLEIRDENGKRSFEHAIVEGAR
jgi:hypothetical protein